MPREDREYSAVDESIFDNVDDNMNLGEGLIIAYAPIEGVPLRRIRVRIVHRAKHQIFDQLSVSTSVLLRSKSISHHEASCSLPCQFVSYDTLRSASFFTHLRSTSTQLPSSAATAWVNPDLQQNRKHTCHFPQSHSQDAGQARSSTWPYQSSLDIMRTRFMPCRATAAFGAHDAPPFSCQGTQSCPSVLHITGEAEPSCV